MNPIFTRRYKGGSRPNIMPTNKRPHYAKSLSSSGASGSSTSPSSSVAPSLNLGESGESGSSPVSEPDTPLFSPSKGRGKGTRNPRLASPSDDSSKRLAQQLLQSKQNMLAQVSLTPHENRQREKVSSQEKIEAFSGMRMRHSFSTDNIGNNVATNNMPRSPTVHDIGGDMKICDLEYEDQTDFVVGGSTSSSTVAANEKSVYSYTTGSVNKSRVSRPNLNQRISKEPLDVKTWRELKQIVISHSSFHDGWIGQGFIFDKNIPFGLIQKKGGPCGVLAVVQSLLIRNLLFGSPYFSHETQDSVTFSEDRLEEIATFLANGDRDEDFAEKIRKERVQCLVDAIAEIIWVCAEQRQKDEKSFSSVDDCVSIIMLSDFRIQPETIRICGKLELQHFLQNSIHRFDCIALVYSAVLTRGIEGVKNDMDFENCSLIGQHGYCSQELINLLCLGKAISNTFDKQVELDGKVLKGIPAQCDIGLLSLFEHYDSIKVGNFMKCPRYPVWIICSESHFSVLFSCEQLLCTQNDSKGLGISSFDLFYYDGLSRQEKIIRLSIRITSNRTCPPRFGNDWDHYSVDKSNHLCAPSNFGNEDLVPPLEKCIRTKWKGAMVDWNDTEPIL